MTQDDEAYRQYQRDRIAEAQRYDAEQAKPKLTDYASTGDTPFPMRIRLKPGTTIAAMFDEEAQHLIIVRGAITTTGRFARFDESLCHLSDDGVIRRYGLVIGSAEDIEYLPAAGVVASEEAQPASVGKDILERVANAPNEADCAMCKGRGFYGIPGGRCTFCKGTGRVQWRSASGVRQSSNQRDEKE